MSNARAVQGACIDVMLECGAPLHDVHALAWRAHHGIGRVARLVGYGHLHRDLIAELVDNDPVDRRPSYGSVRSILDNKLDRKAAAKRTADGPAILHANIRGPRYYN